MENKTLIFGKDDCPYTSDARSDYKRRNIPFDYINVVREEGALEKMLKYSGGKRSVPVIVEEGKVTIGFGGS